MKAVIIGNSAAGTAAASTLRFLKPKDEIVILSKENEPGYSPSLITHYISGEVSHNKVILYPKKWYQRRNIDLRLNQKVVGVDFKKQEVFCEQGQTVNFDKLLIASGALPLFPSPFGTETERVVGVRTLEDGRKIRTWARITRKVAVVGAGFVGLKLASGLRKKQMEVSVVEIAPRVLGNVVDEEAHQRITAHLTGQGITMYCNTKVCSLEKQGDRYYLRLTDGNYLEAHLVIVSAGVTPNREFLHGSPLRCKNALSVNKYQETELPEVYAAGDVCLTRDIQTGKETYNPIWPNAVRQGKVAACNMAGVKVTFPGSMAMNSGEFHNLWINIVGTIDGIEGEAESVIFSNEKCYQRLYLKGGKIVKYISVGNVDYTGMITKAISSQISLNDLSKTYPANQIPVISRYRERRF